MSAELDRGDPSGNPLSSAAPMEPVCAVSTKGFDQAQGSAIISLANYREQPGFRWTESEMSTPDILRLLGEILEPSYRGPFGFGFIEDENYEAFMDALIPVIQAYRANYERILRTVESDRG